MTQKSSQGAGILLMIEDSDSINQSSAAAPVFEFGDIQDPPSDYAGRYVI